MSCENPVYLRNKGLKVSCGKCFSCRQQRAAEWASRLSHEIPFWRFSLFVTLTYDDEHLPKDNQLDVRDYQLFVKSLRDVFGPLKYMIAGEYGSLRGRAHWHMCLFLSRFDLAEFNEVWRRGFTYVKRLDFKSCFYVAMYISKAYATLYGSKPGVYNFSQGIGKRYCLYHEDELRRNLKFLRDDGKYQTLPRQYRVWLGIDESNYVGLQNEARERSRAKLLKVWKDGSPASFVRRVIVSSAQRTRLAVGRYLSKE